MARNDIHSPKNIIPEDYEFVTVRCRDEFFGVMGIGSDVFMNHMKMTGGKFSTHEHKGGCDVCGAWMIDYAIFYHPETNVYIRTGLTCAEKIESGHAEDFRRVSQLRRAAQKRAKKIEVAANKLEELGILDYVETMWDDHIGGKVRGYNIPQNENIKNLFGEEIVKQYNLKMLSEAEGKFYTLANMVRNLVEYGWTDKQNSFAKSLVDYLENLTEKLFEREEEYNAAEDVPEGKIKVSGEILTVKEVEGYYGYQTKMLVKDDRGFKIWTTLPKAISNAERGDRIEFTATLTKSDDDPKFGFGKRPSKAKIL